MKKILFIFLIVLVPLYAYSYGFEYYVNNTTLAYIYNRSVQNISVSNITGSYIMHASLLDDYATEYTFRNVTFSNNSVEAFYLYRGIGSFYNTSFYNNTSGAIFFNAYNRNAIKVLKNVNFSYNSKTGYGGAINVGTSVTSFDLNDLEGVTFDHNSSTQRGGAIYTSAPFTITGKNISFTNNSSANGGAIYVDNNLTIKADGGDITFSNNTATTGGAIYASGNVTLEATEGNISFLNNSPLYIAGNIYLKPHQNGHIIVNDTMNADSGSIYIQGTDNGLVSLNKTLGSKNIYLTSGNLYFATGENWSGINLISNGGKLLTDSSIINSLQLNNVYLNSDLYFIPKLDMQNQSIDSITASASGMGRLKIPYFKIISSQINTPTTVTVANGSIKNNVDIPNLIYDDIYAYNTQYTPVSGQITFTPRYLQEANGFNSARSFNPQAYLQPQLAYSTADNILRMLQLRSDIKRYTRRTYEELNKFYLRPYYQNYKLKFTNDATSKQSNKGIIFGWISKDLEWLNKFIVSSGLYASFQKTNFKQEKISVSSTDYQIGTDLYFDATNFFVNFTGQLGIYNRENIIEDTVYGGGLEAQVGLNFGFDNDKYIQPFADYSMSYISKGKDVNIGTATLHANNMNLMQIKGGIKLLKVSDNTTTYFNIAYLMRKTGTVQYMVNDQLLPKFELDPFFQFGIGCKRYTNNFNILLDLNADIGASQGVEISLSFEF